MKFKLSARHMALTIIFISGLWVRLYHLGTPSLWFDELSTAVRINHPFVETIALLRHSDFPPLHYAILNLWTSFSGNSEWALRFPSAIFSSFTIIIIYLLGCELFSVAVGLLAAALLAFSPFAVNYAQDAKMYALFWFLASTAFLFLFRFVKDHTEASYRRYLVSSILCCYTMYTGFLFLLVQSLIYMLTAKRTGWKKWFKGQWIIISCCLPWLFIFVCSKHVGFNLRPHEAAMVYVPYFVHSLLWIIGNSDDVFWKINYVLYFFLLIYLAIDLAILLSQKKGSTLPLMSYYGLLVWLMASPLIYFIFDRFILPAVLEYRYMGFIQVPLILLVSSQVCRLQGAVRGIIAGVIIAVAMHNTIVYFRDDLRYHQDWRMTAADLSKEISKNDIVLAFLGLPEFKYYYKGDTAHFFPLSKKSIKDCSTEFLVRKNMLAPGVNGIEVLYTDFVPRINLKGFVLDHRVEHGAIGYLYFRRINDKV